MATNNFDYCFPTKVNSELLVNQSIVFTQFPGGAGGGGGVKTCSDL